MTSGPLRVRSHHALAPPLGAIGAFVASTTGTGRPGMAMGEGLWDPGLGAEVMEMSITNDMMQDIDGLSMLRHEAIRDIYVEENHRISGTMSDLAEKEGEARVFRGEGFAQRGRRRGRRGPQRGGGRRHE
jgi:hypothetical protein